MEENHKQDNASGLISKYDGPFEIIKIVQNGAYRLMVPID